VAVYGDVVHTMAGPPIEKGVVVIDGGKITLVGSALDIPVSPAARVVRGKVVTPGLIDAHTAVGLTGYLNQEQDQDQLDKGEPIQPELRAIDSYNPRERLIEWVRGFGITTIHTGHAPGALVSGQTMIAKTVGETVDDLIARRNEAAAPLYKKIYASSVKPDADLREIVAAADALGAGAVKPAAWRPKIDVLLNLIKFVGRSPVGKGLLHRN
jgi:imidazolonepropionase-like amidohydrolase